MATRKYRPSERRHQEALARFRKGEDTRKDRDVLRLYRVDWVTDINGNRRDVPTAEDEDRPAVAEGQAIRRGPRVWKIRGKGERQ